MKGKILAFAIILLMVVGSFGAVGVQIEKITQNSDGYQQSEKATSSMSNPDERYDTYGCNNWGSSNCGTYGEHSLIMWGSPFGADTDYLVDIGCSNYGIMAGSLQIGVYFYDLGYFGDGPTIKIMNFDTGQLETLDENIGGYDSLTWWWSNSIPSSDSYVSGSDKVQITIECWVNDNPVIDMVSVKFIDLEETDQQIINYDGASESGFYAQSFKTSSFKELTRVKFLLDNEQVLNDGDFVFCICNSIQPWDPITSPTACYSARFSYQEVPGPKRWAEVDLPDVELVPNHNYYLCMELTDPSITWYYDANNPYADGSYYLNGHDVHNDWEKTPDKTYCIKTYGKNTDGFDAVLGTDPTNGGSIDFSTVNHGDKRTINMYIKNIGETGSALQWEIKDVSSSWITIDKTSGLVYKHYYNSDNSMSVAVTVDATYLEGNKEGIQYTGSFKVYNKETGEYSTINVKVNVLKTKSVEYPAFYNLFRFLIYKHQILANLFQLLIFDKLNI